MKLNIHGNKIEVTDSIKEYIEKKLEKLNRYFENSDDLEARINIRVKGIEQLIEITVPTKKFTIRSEVADKDLYAATDLAVDKLERQIRKNKTRLNNKYKNLDVQEFVFDYESDEENNEKIVKRKTLESKPMDEEEAILQMELIGHDFFVFKNVKEECISVVYKRKDGHYGIMSIK